MFPDKFLSKLSGNTCCGTAQAWWLTFGHALLNSCHFLAIWFVEQFPHFSGQSAQEIHFRLCGFIDYVFWQNSFLPEVSFGLRVLSLPASVCVCVCPSVSRSVHYQACSCDDSWPVQARIAKFGPEVENNLVKILFFFFFCACVCVCVCVGGGGGGSTLTFKVKFNFKVRFYSILSWKFVHTITHHLFKLGSPN